MVLLQTSLTLRIAETSILPSASFVVLAHPAVAKQVSTTPLNTFVLYWVITYNTSPIYYVPRIRAHSIPHRPT